MANTILYLGDPSTTPGLKKQVEVYMKRCDISPMCVSWLFDLSKDLSADKQDFEKNSTLYRVRLSVLVDRVRPGLIIINDSLALWFLTNGDQRSLDKARGSVYMIGTIPMLVLDSLRTATGSAKLAASPYAGWILMHDLRKAKRWLDRKPQGLPFKFEYVVCENKGQIIELQNHARKALLIACDVETAGKSEFAQVTTFGYSLLLPDLSVKSYTIPMVNPLNLTEKFQWAESPDMLGFIMATLKSIHANDTPKILQNGFYDATYYTAYNMPLKNWILDPSVIFNSIWPEIPKRIDFIASLFCDYYRYWKDEGSVDDKDDRQKTRVPNSQDGWERYLRYNCLDTFYLIHIALPLMKLALSADWIKKNYRTTFRQILGPAFAMSMRGLNVNQGLLYQMDAENISKAAQNLADLRLMLNEPKFNPNSPAQVATVIYDLFKAVPLKQGRGKKKTGGRSTEEKTLQVLQSQHPVLSVVIDTLWNVKKPLNNVSKYGVWQQNKDEKWVGLRLLNGRWYYSLKAAGTETGRYASSESNFWCGTQIQNPPYPVRAMIEPDDGYILWEADYSKADFWHTTYASMNKDMLAVVNNPNIDLHCLHAAKFFSKPYDEIYAGYKNKEPWVVDSLRGVRQNAKRIVYGANYLMGGYTLFLTMGKEAVEATALAMGENIGGWGVQNFIKFCQQLLDFYYSNMYPDLLPWLETEINRTARNSNRAECCGGKTRTFFADLQKDKNAQRELAAFFGQGGTAGMINKALDDIYYGGLDNSDCMLLAQIHDAAIGQVRIDKLHLLPQIQKAMEITNEMNGQKFVVPVDLKVGLGAGYRMTDWHSGITIDEIKSKDNQWWEKNNYVKIQ